MITVVAKNIIKKGRLDDVLSLCKELVYETLKEKGCIQYELHQDIENECILTMIEKWESNADLENHMASEHFKRLAPKFVEMLDAETDMNIYEKLM